MAQSSSSGRLGLAPNHKAVSGCIGGLQLSTPSGGIHLPLDLYFIQRNAQTGFPCCPHLPLMFAARISAGMKSTQHRHEKRVTKVRIDIDRIHKQLHPQGSADMPRTGARHNLYPIAVWAGELCPFRQIDMDAILAFGSSLRKAPITCLKDFC